MKKSIVSLILTCVVCAAIVLGCVVTPSFDDIPGPKKHGKHMQHWLS